MALDFDERTGILSCEAGAVVSRKLVATGSPTGWTISGLPTGLSISSAGLISGTEASGSGLYPFTGTVTDGSSTVEFSGIWVVTPPSGFGESDELEFVIDAETGLVTLPGIPEGYDPGPPSLRVASEESTTPPRFAIKTGTRQRAAFIFERRGVRLDFGTLHSLSLPCREFSNKADFDLIRGQVTGGGDGEDTVYRAALFLDPDDWERLVRKRELPLGAAFDPLGAIRWVVNEGGTNYSEPRSLALSPISGKKPNLQTKTLSFTGVPALETADTFTLALALSVTGLPSQDCALSKGLDIAYADGTYVASAITGGVLDQGDDETASGQWRTRFQFVEAVGTASGLNVTVEVDASEVADVHRIVVDVQDNIDASISSGALVLSGDWEFTATDDAGVASAETFVLSNGDEESDVLSAATAIASAVEFDETAQTITFILSDDTYDSLTDDQVFGYWPREFVEGGGSRAATVSGTLSIASYTALRKRETETFRFRAEASLATE